LRPVDKVRDLGTVQIGRGTGLLNLVALNLFESQVVHGQDRMDGLVWDGLVFDCLEEFFLLLFLNL